MATTKYQEHLQRRERWKLMADAEWRGFLAAPTFDRCPFFSKDLTLQHCYEQGFDEGKATLLEQSATIGTVSGF